jgi:hypothetical protein
VVLAARKGDGTAGAEACEARADEHAARGLRERRGGCAVSEGRERGRVSRGSSRWSAPCGRPGREASGGAKG